MSVDYGPAGVAHPWTPNQGGGGGAVPLAGDVTGTSAASVVSELQGVTLDLTAPLTDNGVLTYDLASNTLALEAPASSGVVIGTAGADADRLAATTGLIGSIYTGTDTAVRYLCESDGAGGARWCRVGGNGTEGRDTTGIITGASRNASGDTNIDGSTVTGFAVCFSLAALPIGGRILFSVLQAGPTGFQLEIGEDGVDRGLLGIYRSGLSSARRVFTGATVAGALNAPHCIAVRFDGANTRYSLDGAGVLEVTDTGTATHGTTPVRLNTNGAGGAGPDADHLGFKLWSTALTDPDLVAISGAYATGRIPDVAGATIVSDWHAARYPEWVTAQRIIRGAVKGVLSWNGAPPMVIR